MPREQISFSRTRADDSEKEGSDGESDARGEDTRPSTPEPEIVEILDLDEAEIQEGRQCDVCCDCMLISYRASRTR